MNAHLNPVLLLAEPLRPQDENGAGGGVQPHLLRKDRLGRYRRRRNAHRLPVSVCAFFVRKSIVQGLTMGALKG
jgi:hypothetical protein